MKVLLIGTNPIGYYLLKFLKGEHEIWLLVEEKWATKLSKEGALIIKERMEEREIPIDLATYSLYEFSGERVDLIIMSEFAYMMKNRFSDISELDIQTNSLIIASNALGVEEELPRELLKKTNLMRCITNSVVIWDEIGKIRIPYRENLFIGFINKQSFNNSDVLKGMISNEIILSKKILEDLWRIAVIQSAIYYPTAILNLSLDMVLKDKHLREIIDNLLIEGERVARSSGLRVRGLIGEVIKMAPRLPRILSPINSLWAMRIPSEVDYFNGFICRKGAERGIQAFVNWTIWKLVKIIEEKRKIQST